MLGHPRLHFRVGTHRPGASTGSIKTQPNVTIYPILAARSLLSKVKIPMLVPPNLDVEKPSEATELGEIAAYAMATLQLPVGK